MAPKQWSLGKAVFILAAYIFIHLPRTLALLSTYNVATLPSLLLVLLGKTGM